MKHATNPQLLPTAQPLRVAVYARVSTVRQAEADLSIPDQLAQAKSWSARLGHELVREYIEPGASGTDESRPVFQQMLSDARTQPRPFDIILVHSFSRFARDNLAYAIAKQTLKKAGISIQSISQPLSDDPTGELVEAVLTAVDAHHSRENAKHTSRAMKENARQGFWNGSPAPFGYVAAEAERRGDKIKKKLEVNEAEAAIVRRIYDFYRGSEGPQYGVKAIASKLNAEGTTFRGKPFMISNVHRILTDEVYAGRHYFNRRDTRAKLDRPREDWIPVEVPAIIPRAAFELVREQLAERAPRKTPARIVSSPTLLTGIAVCAHCGAGMTLRTGKGYRYYACAGRAQKGPTSCGGCAVPIPKTDQAVIDTLTDKVFAPDRLKELVSGYLEKARAEAQQQRSQLSQIKAELTETEGALNRLLGMVETGLMEIDDPVLRDRMMALKAKRLALNAQIEQASDLQPANRPHLTEAKLQRLSEAVRAALHTAPPEMRKAYIKLFVDKAIISKETIELTGPKSVLAKAALTDLPNATSEVITFVREWRPVRDGIPADCQRHETIEFQYRLRLDLYGRTCMGIAVWHRLQINAGSSSVTGHGGLSSTSPESYARPLASRASPPACKPTTLPQPRHGAGHTSPSGAPKSTAKKPGPLRRWESLRKGWLGATPCNALNGTTRTWSAPSAPLRDHILATRAAPIRLRKTPSKWPERRCMIAWKPSTFTLAEPRMPTPWPVSPMVRQRRLRLLSRNGWPKAASVGHTLRAPFLCTGPTFSASPTG
jgi:DNA invertase Pin-like site-specific DNA recombinase